MNFQVCYRVLVLIKEQNSSWKERHACKERQYRFQRIDLIPASAWVAANAAQRNGNSNGDGGGARASQFFFTDLSGLTLAAACQVQHPRRAAVRHCDGRSRFSVPHGGHAVHGVRLRPGRRFVDRPSKFRTSWRRTIGFSRGSLDALVQQEFLSES